jgi:sulfocyanin
MTTASLAKAMRRVLATAIIGGAVAMVPGTTGMAATAHTVDVSIVAGKDAGGGGFDFNGYRNGAMTITVPVGWQVVVHFTNANDLPHSVAILPVGAEKLPVPGGTPVFSGATTKDLVAGLPKGAKQTFTFDAVKPGTYEFVCGVSGHAVAGMWDKLIVSSTAETPSVTPAGAATLTVDAK